MRGLFVAGSEVETVCMTYSSSAGSALWYNTIHTGIKSSAESALTLQQRAFHHGESVAGPKTDTSNH